MTLVKCAPGKLSTLTFDNPDCPECRSISRITQSADGLSVTFYYTDGTSQIFTLPRGLTGATGAAGAAGTTGVVLLYNEYSDAESALTGSYQTLDSFNLDAAQLGANGDMIHIHAVFNVLVAPTNPDANLVRIQIGGNDLIEQSLGENSGSNLAVDIYLSRTGATDGKYEFVSVFTDGSNWLNQKQIAPSAAPSTTWANAQTISVQTNQVAANSIQLKVLQITFIAQS